jgi:hypothetical protein
LDAVYMMAKAAEGMVSVPVAQPTGGGMSPLFRERKKKVSPWSNLRK